MTKASIHIFNKKWNFLIYKGDKKNDVIKIISPNAQVPLRVLKHSNMSRLSKAVEGTDHLKQFLSACLASLTDPEAFQKFIEDPSTKPCYSLHIISTLLENRFLVFTVWLAAKTNLISIYRNESLIHQSPITKVLYKHIMTMDINTDEKNSLEILEILEKLEGPVIKEMSSNILHERLHILRGKDLEGFNGVKAASKPGKSHCRKNTWKHNENSAFSCH